MGPRRLEVEERAAICNTQSFIGISDTLVSLGPGALLTGVLLIIVIACRDVSRPGIKSSSLPAQEIGKRMPWTFVFAMVTYLHY